MAIFTQGLANGIKKKGGVGAGQYVYLKGDGDQMTIAPLVKSSEIVSYQEHNIWRTAGGSKYFPCIAGDPSAGGECPGCQMGIQTRWRATMPVFVTSDPAIKGEVKLFSFGKQLAKDLAAIAEMFNPTGDPDKDQFKGACIIVRRSGKGLSTRYSTMPTTERVVIPEDLDVPNIADTMPQTREAILTLISDVQPESEAGVPSANDLSTNKF